MQDAGDIQKAFSSIGFNSLDLSKCYRLADWPLSPASSFFIRAAWQAWIRSLPKKLKIRRRITDAAGHRRLATFPRYIPNRWDCDNHASDFAAFLARRHACKIGSSTGLAKGVVWYDAELKINNPVTGPHAINWYHDGDHIHFFEPATGKNVTLSPNEISTIRHINAN